MQILRKQFKHLSQKSGMLRMGSNIIFTAFLAISIVGAYSVYHNNSTYGYKAISRTVTDDLYSELSQRSVSYTRTNTLFIAMAANYNIDSLKLLNDAELLGDEDLSKIAAYTGQRVVSANNNITGVDTGKLIFDANFLDTGIVESPERTHSAIGKIYHRKYGWFLLAKSKEASSFYIYEDAENKNLYIFDVDLVEGVL